MTIPFEAWGWLASACVLAAFLMRRMRPLRILAIASNLAFLVYASALELWPVLALHAVLLPVNLWRLRDADAGAPPASPGPAPRPVAPRRPLARWAGRRAVRLRRLARRRAPAICAAALLALLLPRASWGGEPAGPAADAVLEVVRVGPVVGILALPAAPTGLVVLLPDTLGFDMRSHRYVEELLRAGLAAIDLHDGADDPAALAAALPALRAAAGAEALPLGVVGFGAGARVALGLGDAVAARVLLYPGCATATPAAALPTLLLHGEADPANPRAACAALAARLGPPGKVAHVAYRAAHYAWDYPSYGLAMRIMLPSPDGEGLADAEPWPELAAMTASRAAEFLAVRLAEAAR